MLVGILALQGCIEPHRPHLEALRVDVRLIRQPKDIDGVDAFILPGGESTTILTLLRRVGLWEPLASALQEKPAWGICAGAILMAEQVLSPAQESFALFPCTIERNAYGRQLASRRLKLNQVDASNSLTHEEVSAIKSYDVYLIRAPKIRSVSSSARVLACYQDEPIFCLYDKYMLTTFHPELNPEAPSPIHRFFARWIQERG